MAVLFDWTCKFCGQTYEAWTDCSSCGRCGGTGERQFSRATTFEWGGPRFIRSLQRTFDSRSSLNRWLREHNMMQSPAADKRGGAHLGDREAPRVSRIHFDPRAKGSKSKGTWQRVDGER